MLRILSCRAENTHVKNAVGTAVSAAAYGSAPNNCMEIQYSCLLGASLQGVSVSIGNDDALALCAMWGRKASAQAGLLVPK
jgi:hypothetical protein